MLGRLRALVCAPVGPARAPGPLLQQLRGMAKYAANTMKRRYRGLYDGKHIKFGNTISFSHKKCASSPRELSEVRLTHGARAQDTAYVEAQRAAQALLVGDVPRILAVPDDDVGDQEGEPDGGWHRRVPDEDAGGDAALHGGAQAQRA